MNTIPLKDHLNGIQSNPQYQTYVTKLILLFRQKLTEGAMIDVPIIGQQIKGIIQNRKGTICTLTPQLKAQLCVMFVEWRVKMRSKQLKQQLEELQYILKALRENERRSVIYKVNCMILYDINFEGYIDYLEHEDRVAVGLFRKGKYTKAVEILEKVMNSNTHEYHNMRKVWIGRILMEAYDLSAFTWLYEVISDDQNKQPSNDKKTINGTIEKYEAKLLFTSGFKILCERKGNDPEIAGVVKIHEKSVQYLNQIQKMKEVRNTVKEFQKLKIISEECFDDYKIKNTLDALKVLDQITWFPKPSLVELDLRIQLSNLFEKGKKTKEAKKQVSRCKAIAEDLGVYTWQRKKILERISKSSNNAQFKQQLTTQMDESTKAINQSFTKTLTQKKIEKKVQNKVSLNEQKKLIVLKDKQNVKHLPVEVINTQSIKPVKPVKAVNPPLNIIKNEQSFDFSSQSEEQQQSENEQSEQIQQKKQNKQSKQKRQRKSNKSNKSSKSNKQNKNGKTTKPNLNRASRKNYQFHRKTIGDNIRSSELQDEPHCCLLF